MCFRRCSAVLVMMLLLQSLSGCGNKEDKEAGPVGPETPLASGIDVAEGRELFAKDDYQAAIEWAENKLQKEPGHLECRLILALGRLALEDLTGAKNVTTALLEEHGNESRVVTTHAMVLAAGGEAKKAIELLESRLSDSRDDIHMHFALATLYQLQGDALDAEQHFSMVTSIDPRYDGIPVSGEFQAFADFVKENAGKITVIFAAIIKVIAALAG